MATYPIYRRELVHWDARLGGHWRLGEVFGMLTLASLCLLPATIIIFPALLAVYAILDEFIGLCLTLPASMLVVREREAHTWSLLRATPFSGTQIGVGKLSGLFYQVWEGVGYLIGARWLGTVLVLPLLALMLTLPKPYPFAQGPGAILAVAGLALAYLAFVYRPLLNLLFGGALGLAASTVVRSSGGAVVLSTLLGGAATVASGAWVWLFVTSHGAEGLFSESVLAGRLEGVFMWLIPLAVVSLVRLLLTGGLLLLAGRRITGIAE